MRNLTHLLFILCIANLLNLSLFNTSSHALDPYAKAENKKMGYLWVKTPLPASDQIKAKNMATGQEIQLTPEKLTHVAIGKYTITIQLQNTSVSEQATVSPTERTDVTIVGYGNLKVNGPQGQVSVSGKKNKKFKTNQIVTLPTGSYTVKIKAKGANLKAQVQIISNTTREIDFKL